VRHLKRELKELSSVQAGEKNSGNALTTQRGRVEVIDCREPSKKKGLKEGKGGETETLIFF